MRKKCFYCDVEVVTYVEHEGNAFFGVVCIFSLFIFGFLCLVILPVVFFLTKNAVHRCSKCLQKLGEKKCIGLPEDFREPIWHIRLGKCSIVTSRIYAILAVLLFSVGAGYYVYERPSLGFHQNPLFHHNQETHEIDASWTDYLQDCGGEQVIENFVHTKLVFNDKYENYGVRWSGFLAEVKNQGAPIVPFFNNQRHMSLLVKMQPSESVLFADLVLSVSSNLYQENKALIDGLVKGDGIDFEATVVGLGNEFKMHHLQAKSFSKNGQFKELEDIVVRESALP